MIPRIRLTSAKDLVEVEAELGKKQPSLAMLNFADFFHFFLSNPYQAEIRNCHFFFGK